MSQFTRSKNAIISIKIHRLANENEIVESDRKDGI